MKIILRLAVCAVLVSQVAAFAQSPAYYVATPSTPPAKTPLVTRSTLWHARRATYLAVRGPEQPAILCRVLADQVGRLAAFSADGKPMDADQLARCNAKVAPETIAAR